MRAHNLIWGAPNTSYSPHNPQFVIDEQNATKLEELMNDYIPFAMNQIGDYPFAWDVVNEAVSDNKG